MSRLLSYIVLLVSVFSILVNSADHLVIDGQGHTGGTLRPGESVIVRLNMPASSSSAPTARHSIYLGLSTCSMPPKAGELGPPKALPLMVGLFLNTTIGHGLWENGGVHLLGEVGTSPHQRRAEYNATVSDIFYEVDNTSGSLYADGLVRLRYYEWAGDVAYAVATAPSDKGRQNGTYTFNLAFSTVSHPISLGSGQPMRVIDADVNSALLGVVSSIAPSANYSIYVRPAMAGYLTRSICGVQGTGTRLENGTNAIIQTITPTIDLANSVSNGLSLNKDPKANITLYLWDQMNKFSGLRVHILGLSANTSYEVFYFETSELGPSVGKMWVTNIVHTMANDNCRIIYDLPNCPFIAQTVPAPRQLHSYYPAFDRNIAEDTAMPDISNKTALSMLYSDLAESQMTNFNQFLALNDETSLFYSQMRDCSDCRVVYFAWLCSIMAPRCIDSFERDLNEPDFASMDKAIPGIYNVYRQLMLNSIPRYIGSEAGSDYGVGSENGAGSMTTLSQKLPGLRVRDAGGSGNESDSGQCPLDGSAGSKDLGFTFRDLPNDTAGNVTHKRTDRISPRTPRPRQRFGRRRQRRTYRTPKKSTPKHTKHTKHTKRTIEWDVNLEHNYDLDDTAFVFPCRGASCLFPESNDTYLELMPCIDSCLECIRSCPPTLEFGCPTMRHIGTFYRSYGRPIELTDDFVYKLRLAFHPYMAKEFESGIYTMAARENWTASSARFGYWLYNRVGKVMPAFLCASSGSQVIPSTTSDKGSSVTEEAADFTGLNWGYCLAIAAGYFLIRALFKIFIP